MLLSLLPQPPDFVPLSHSWCARPLCPRPGAIPHPFRVRAGPPVGWALLPVGWEFLPAESQAAGGGNSPLSPELSLDLEKVTLPLGDVCIPFLNCPSKVFPLRRSCYSPDPALSLFRMGAAGFLSPGPPLPVPQPPPLPYLPGSQLGLWSGAAPCLDNHMGYPKSLCGGA